TPPASLIQSASCPGGQHSSFWITSSGASPGAGMLPGSTDSASTIRGAVGGEYPPRRPATKSFVSTQWQAAATTSEGSDAPIHRNHPEYSRLIGSGSRTQYVAIPAAREISALGFTPAQKW